MIKLGKYKHYKGNIYEVVGIANHSETLDKMVVYKALYGDNELWVRPLEMWDNDIKLSDGSIVKRFEFIEE